MKQLPALEPLPTDIGERWQPDGNIRAFIFDIYGTLLISASGDIDQAAFSNRSAERALHAANIEIRDDKAANRQETLQGLLNDFRRTIENEHNKQRQEGIPHPEIIATDIWRRVLKEYHRAQKLIISKHSDINVFTFLFELMSNPVYPMPGMKQVLQKLHEKGLPLGIVSNAQFYTPMIMNHFLEGTFQETNTVEYFDPRLTVYSYQEGRSKPDPVLFRKIAERLHHYYGIRAENALYIGNDMYKDIWTATKAGFRTALFAGDRRSLRLREGHHEVGNLQPDFIIRELSTLLKIIEKPHSLRWDNY